MPAWSFHNAEGLGKITLKVARNANPILISALCCSKNAYIVKYLPKITRNCIWVGRYRSHYKGAIQNSRRDLKNPTSAVKWLGSCNLKRGWGRGEIGKLNKRNHKVFLSATKQFHLLFVIIFKEWNKNWANPGKFSPKAWKKNISRRIIITHIAQWREKTRCVALTWESQEVKVTEWT